ncbi:MAG TPA: ABC transporter permease [Gemmatimonadales bacterium]|nr:ABC transporter permease [Gemmatimonadales bacterium]
MRLLGLDLDRLAHLARKELTQTLRDPRALRVIFMAPILQLIVFGYAVNTDVRNTALVLYDRDNTATSRQLVEELTASGYFRVEEVATRAADLAEALDHGRAILALEIPRGLQTDLGSGRPATVQLLIDGTTSNTATVAQAYASQIILRFGQEHGSQVAQTARLPGGKTPGVDLRVRAWYNPNLESRVYNVPGVVGNLMMLMSLLLTTLAVVRERELGTLEQLMVSPLTPAEMIVGKTLPVVGIAMIDLALITSVATLWFHIPLRGSLALLFLVSLAYVVCGLGIGLLISTVSNTTQEAFMTMFMFFLPAMILSGFFFPVENMPRLFQYLTLINPVRYYVEAVRAIFLKGAGLAVLWPELAVLAAMGGTILWFASTRFRKTSA